MYIMLCIILIKHYRCADKLWRVLIYGLITSCAVVQKPNDTRANIERVVSDNWTFYSINTSLYPAKE